MSYEHERYDSREKQSAFNTVWPKVANDEVAANEFRHYLRSRRLNFETAYLAGWYPAWLDTLRVVIPCVSLQEGHAYYQARAFNKAVKLRYVSPPGPRHGALCVVDPTDDLTEGLIPAVTAIVEGPMDALALAGLGIRSIALMGIKPDIKARAHLLQLIKRRKDRAVILFDNEDEAQAEAALLAVELAGKGVASQVYALDSKDVAASSDGERLAIVKRIQQWER